MVIWMLDFVELMLVMLMAVSVFQIKTGVMDHCELCRQKTTSVLLYQGVGCSRVLIVSSLIPTSGIS